METAPQKPEAASADQHREEEQSCVVLGVIVAPGLARDVTAKIAAELGDDLRALNTGVDWRTELTVLPLAWQVETARSHESNYVAPLLDAARTRGFTPTTVAMDMGYDNDRVYVECAEREVVPIIPLRKNSGHRESSIPRKSDQWRSLYRRRSSVEREFGRLNMITASRSCAFAALSAFGFTLTL